MSEEKPVPADKKEDELSESEIADIAGGLNPQPLPRFCSPGFDCTSMSAGAVSHVLCPSWVAPAASLFL